jgi:hypothetical protein
MSDRTTLAEHYGDDASAICAAIAAFEQMSVAVSAHQMIQFNGAAFVCEGFSVAAHGPAAPPPDAAPTLLAIETPPVETPAPDDTVH